MNIVSVTDLRQNATNILNQLATHEPTFVVQNSQLKAVIMDPINYQTLQETIEDFQDGLDSHQALKQPRGVNLDNYAYRRWHGSKTKIRSRKRPR